MKLMLLATLTASLTASLTIAQVPRKQDSTTALPGSIQDNSGSTVITRPNASGSSLPMTCSGAQTFFLTSGPSGQNNYGCVGGVFVLEGGAGAGIANPGNIISVSFSATPTFTCTSSSAGTVTTFVIGSLTGNITGSTLSGCTPGQILQFDFTQDATGGRTVVWPGGFAALSPPSPIALTETIQACTWDGTNCKTPGALSPQSVIPVSVFTSATPPAGYLFCQGDSTQLTQRCKNSSGVFYSQSVEGVGIRIGGGANTIDSFIAPGTGVSGALGRSVNGSTGNICLSDGSCSSGLPSFGVGTTPMFSGSSGTYLCTGTCSAALPTPAVGSGPWTIANDDNVTSVITLPGLGAGAMYEDTAFTHYGTPTTGTVTSGGAVGDSITFQGKDSTHYNVVRFRGTWTQHTPSSAVTVGVHALYLAGSGSPTATCSFTGTNPYIVTCTTNSFTITNSGDAVSVSINFAMDMGLSGPCSDITVQPTVTDGTNTYTLRAGPGVITGAGFCSYAFTAKNVTALTHALQIQFTETFSTQAGSYLQVEAVELSGVNTTSEADTNLSIATGGSATTSPTITSPGNVSATGEVAIAFITNYTSVSSCGAGWVVLDSTVGSAACYINNPASGSALTFAPTQSSSVWNGSMVGLKP